MWFIVRRRARGQRQGKVPGCPCCLRVGGSEDGGGGGGDGGGVWEPAESADGLFGELEAVYAAWCQPPEPLSYADLAFEGVAGRAAREAAIAAGRVAVVAAVCEVGRVDVLGAREVLRIEDIWRASSGRRADAVAAGLSAAVSCYVAAGLVVTTSDEVRELCQLACRRADKARYDLEELEVAHIEAERAVERQTARLDFRAVEQFRRAGVP